jgi:hypothetical protein
MKINNNYSAFAKAFLHILFFLSIIVYSPTCAGKKPSMIEQNNANSSLMHLYLDSCPAHAILFVGDGTLALQLGFLQQVYNYRTDIVIIDKNRMELPSYYFKIINSLKVEQQKHFQLPQEILNANSQINFPINTDEKRVTNLKQIDQHFENDSLYIIKNNQNLKYFPGRNIGILEKDFNFRFSALEKMNDAVRVDVVTKISKQNISRGELITLSIIQSFVGLKPICFTMEESDEHFLNMQPFLIQHGIIEILQPLRRVTIEGQSNSSKIVLTSDFLKTFFDNKTSTSNLKKISNTNVTHVIRKANFVEARWLLENADTINSLKLMDQGLKAYPIKQYGVDDYTFGMGNLYQRAGNKESAILLTESYYEQQFLNFENGMKSFPIDQRDAVNSKSKQFKYLKDGMTTYLNYFPDNKEYWLKKLKTTKEKYKKWARDLN